jgi:hypothetical protein
VLRGFFPSRRYEPLISRTHFFARLLPEVDNTMIGTRAVTSVVLLAVATSISVAAADKYKITQDPQAVAVAQAAFTAMGGAQGIAGYQDSVASGTVTKSVGGNPVSYPITMKSKGLRETRTELQLPKGINVRIVNQGQGVIVRPDGSVKALDPNNTFYEHVGHVPLLSALAEFQNENVNLLYQGTAQVQGQSEYVIEINFVPNLDPIQGRIFASMNRTLFFVNQTTHLVDKIQDAPFNEGDSKHTYTEEVYLSDYRLVAGVLVPFRLTLFVDAQLDTDVEFGSVKFNVGLPDSDFALPQVR